MNLKIIFITLATATLADNSFCSFNTCSKCQQVISSGGPYQNLRHKNVAKTCRKIFKMPNCCEKFKRCEVLTECIPIFPMAFQSRYYQCDALETHLSYSSRLRNFQQFLPCQLVLFYIDYVQQNMFYFSLKLNVSCSPKIKII